jgi:predicted nucleic acid-binding protein
MSSFGALLDACVLIPAPLCDTLLRAAEKGLYRVHWSEDILSEVQRNLSKQLGVPCEKAARRVRLMREAFEEAFVDGHEQLIPSMTNDEKDRHVLAAAVVSGSQVIVTANLGDFPPVSLDQHSIEAQSPDEFLTNLFDLYPDDMLQIIREQADALQHPRTSIEDVVRAIARDAPHFANLVQRQLDVSRCI